jgi:SWI/SNF-related matrix-associated actin-dependent regulator of chromatin subfamily B protein 1
MSLNEYSADAHSAVDAIHTDPNRAGAIQETKDKAKAIVMASNLDANSTPDAAENGQANASLPPSDAAVNGEPKSRKRSRSGERIRIPDSRGAYPIETDTDRYALLRAIERDADYAANKADEMERVKQLYAAKKDEKVQWDLYWERIINTPAYQAWRMEPRVIYPAERRRSVRWTSRRKHVDRTKMLEQADLVEDLVPIRLEIEHDRIKLRDTFTWNLHDTVTDVDNFAEGLIQDFNVPMEIAPVVIRQASDRVREQIQEYYPHVFVTESGLDPQLPYSAYKNDEMRILIKLNITIGTHTLVDQFEWDINNPLNQPEEFAQIMATDLSLSGEFTTAIAHQIREQSQMFTKSLYITSHPFDGRPIDDADVRDSFLPTPVTLVFRNSQAAKDYTPYLYELSEADLQREELAVLREQRRQKRSITRRGGPALPDLKDRERTIRTLVVSSVIPAAAESIDAARLFKLSRSSGRSRRTGRTDGDDSDESESEESEMESEVPILPVQTSRGRIVRNAASVAQAAMRATIGRSATPEVSAIQHHEPRSSARKPPAEVRDDSTSESPSLIVKLRVPKELFRQWVQNPRMRLHRPKQVSDASAAQRGSPATNSEGRNWQYREDGGVEISQPPKAGQQVSMARKGEARVLTSLVAASAAVALPSARGNAAQVPQRFV